MKVRLKKRRSIRGSIFKGIIVILVLVISFVLCFKLFYNSINLDISNNDYISYLVRDSFSHYDFSDLNRLSSTEFLLKYSFGIEKINTGINLDITKPIEKGDISAPEVSVKPSVYIYNTHQTEGYKSNFLESFNINNTVFLASHILGEYLSDLGIGVVVEENSIVDVLNTNGWKYGSSYKASRILMEQAFKENDSLNFFIDLHRDSASYDRTMVEVDGVKYARVMFVVGLEHDNYQDNLNLANNINEKLKEFNPNISRGVLEKKGVGVNGKYNQDFNKNTILIEVGGQYNYIEEVNNTLKVLANILYDFVGGNA